jgi:hypothetical protein
MIDMAKLTRKQLDEKLKLNILEKVSTFLENDGEEVLRTKSNIIALPAVDEEGNDTYVTITFSVPTGTRQGDAYNGHEEAINYAHDVNEKAKKKAAKAEEDAKKAAKDKAKREAAAKAREKAEG